MSHNIGIGLCMCYLVTLLNWTHVFDWRVVKWGSMNNYHKDTYLKKIRLHFHFSFFLNYYSTLNNDYYWEDRCIQIYIHIHYKNTRPKQLLMRHWFFLLHIYIYYLSIFQIYYHGRFLKKLVIQYDFDRCKMSCFWLICLYCMIPISKLEEVWNWI